MANEVVLHGDTPLDWCDSMEQVPEVVAVCCASALGVAVFVSADLVNNPSQTMRIETSA